MGDYPVQHEGAGFGPDWDSGPDASDNKGLRKSAPVHANLNSDGFQGAPESAAFGTDNYDTVDRPGSEDNDGSEAPLLGGGKNPERGLY